VDVAANTLEIAFVTPEVVPFVKVGGLADVSGVLPRQLADKGHDVRLFVPFYRDLDHTGHDVEPLDRLGSVTTDLGGHPYTWSVFVTKLPDCGVPVHLIHCPDLYGRPGVYTDDPDEHRRFLLLVRAAIETCQHLGWGPDLFHCHDWQTAMLPLLLKARYGWDRLFESTRTVLTLHNLGFQGIIPATAREDVGLGDNAYLLHQEDLAAGRINFLKHGIMYADRLTTVSPTYAREIQTEAQGMGLHEMLARRSDALVGIMNGVDDSVWNPRTDAVLPARYSVKSLWRKEIDKEALLGHVGLPYEKGVPVIGLVSRLTWQKGLDLLPEPLEEALAERDVRFVALGTGEEKYERMMDDLAARYPDKAAHVGDFDDVLAHLIEAGSDLFLMPSRYEPCGLNQMYSLTYGTVPIVHRTGGLADSVTLWDPDTGEGDGIVFDHFEKAGLRWAIRTGLDLYEQKKTWRKIQANGMAKDFSWEGRAAEYVAMYRELVRGESGAVPTHVEGALEGRP
jgi:starch synthase